MFDMHERGLSMRSGRGGYACTAMLLIWGLLFIGGCGGDSQEAEAASQARALQVLERFLQAVQDTQLEEAYACLNDAQQAESPLSEFVEGYQAGTISISKYEIEGIGEPEPDIKERYKEHWPFLVPKGTVTLLAVKNDGLTAPGQKRLITVPLSWILMVHQGRTWRVQGKSWGPLHTVAFFGRPDTIVNPLPGYTGPTPMRYEDDTRRYEIMRPENWHDRSRHPALAGFSKTRPVALLEHSGKDSLPNITIQTYDVTRYPSIRSAMDYASVARSSKRGTELRAPISFSHGPMNGVRWEYEYRMGFTKVHSVTDYYLDGRTMILVSSVSKPDRFKQDKDEIVPILDSFRFAPKTASAAARVSP